jgi:hypothetical protein
MRRKAEVVLLVTAFFLAVIGALSANPAYADPELTYHGQFRINYYAESKSDSATFGDSDSAAERLRFRPTFDVKVSEDVSTHLQMNIGHIKENTGNARTNNGGEPAFGLRHAVIQAKLDDSWTGVAGLVPVSDKFGDTLFSGDWDFNPLALAFIGKVGVIDVRVGFAKLQENSENDWGVTSESAATATSPAVKTKGKLKDDVDAYVLDLDMGGLGASVYYVDSQKGSSLGEATMAIYGVRFATAVDEIKFNAFVMGSALDAKAAGIKSSGVAGKAEVKMPLGGATLGVMGLFASGDKDFGKAGKTAGAFITPMSLIGHHGYWGYTGKLNIQGPTDTGIDDPVNIDGGSYGNANLGHGITTAQVNFAMPLSEKMSVYLAGGWFTSNAAADGKSKDIGVDAYAQGKYNLGKGLNLEFGVDYVALGAGSHMTVDKNKARNITTMFSRLQLEY